MPTQIVNPADFLPAPEAISEFDDETIYRQWRTEMVERCSRLGIPFNSTSIEVDPSVVTAQAMSWKRFGDRQWGNDVYRGLRLSVAVMNNLEGLAADLGVKRLTLVPATQNSLAIMESDDSLRLRTWLRIQTFGTGSPEGIEYLARSRLLADIADAHTIDNHGEGTADLILLPPPEDEQPEDFNFQTIINRCHDYVNSRKRRPGSVPISVFAAEVLTVGETGVIGIRRGASTTANLQAAEASWRSYMSRRRNIGANIPYSGVDNAIITKDIVYYRRPGPATDYVITERQAAQAGTWNVTAEFTDE